MSSSFSPDALVDHASQVRRASRALAHASTTARNDALISMATALRDDSEAILEANRGDVDAAQDAELDDAFIDRLILTPERIDKMASAIEEIAALDDPIGGHDRMWTRPNGLKVARRRIPLGTVAIIYESRPNVTSDAAALCLKSGNGVLLKGGSDAFESNLAVVAALRQGLAASALDDDAAGALGFVDTTDRRAVQTMLALSDQLDVVIPRGGKGLIEFVDSESQIPVIKHDEGVCHVVVDGSAEADEADDIVLNAKVQRPGVCNAAETLLVLDDGADTHLPRLLDKLDNAGVRLHLCERSAEAARQVDVDDFKAADDAAYAAEFLDLELAVRVVDNLDEAMDHIARFGSDHTEAIVTNDYEQSRRFVDEVDSSVVLVNASTRFSDGGQLGLGAEIGISTTRMHAYGPMGLRELTTTKFVVLGRGQVRQ